MKKYSVYVLLSNGHEERFETNTNLYVVRPTRIGPMEWLVTEEGHAFNVEHIKQLKVTEK